MSNRLDSDWWYTRALCYPQVAQQPWGEELYKTCVAHGELRAQVYLSDVARKAAPTTEMLRKTHYFIFGEVYPFAGQFRGAKDTLVHEKERGASSHANITRDLEGLQREAAAFLQTASTKQDLCRFIAGYQARLVQIQPFLDGNKRVALRVANEQVRGFLHQEPKLALGWDHYVEGLEAGIRHGKLGPLSYALTEEPLVGRLARPPFTMALTLHQGLQR